MDETDEGSVTSLKRTPLDEEKAEMRKIFSLEKPYFSGLDFSEEKCNSPLN